MAVHRKITLAPGIYLRGKHLWLNFTLPLPSGASRRYLLPARWPMHTGPRAENVTEARRFLKLILGHLQGEAQAEGRKGGPTVGDICDAFLKGYRGPKVRDLAAYRSDARALLAHVQEHLGPQRAETLTALDVERMDAALEDGKKSPQTRLHVLHRLSKAFAWARKQGILHRADNPARDADKPSLPPSAEPIAPERYLTAAEVASLLAWSAKHAPTDAPLYATAVYTGMRQGNLLRLRWTDVDFDGGRIFLRRTKAGASHSVDIHPDLRAILKAWRKQPEHTPDGLVFGEPDGSPRVPLTVRRRLAKALKGAEVRSVRFHDLRHTANTLLAKSGVDVTARMRIIGWKSVAMAMRYDHLMPTLSAGVGKIKIPKPRRPKRAPEATRPAGAA